MKLFPLDVSVFSPNLFPFPLGTSEVSEVKKKKKKKLQVAQTFSPHIPMNTH